MKPAQLLATCIAAGLIAGCASGVTRDAPAGAPKMQPNLKVASLKLNLTPEAEERRKQTSWFSPTAMEDRIRSTLTSEGLLDASAQQTLEVEVTNLRVRSQFNAAMWGFMAGADNITGTVHVKGIDGRPMTKFEVSASWALGGGLGASGQRMSWLYEEFAKLLAAELKGGSAESK